MSTVTGSMKLLIFLVLIKGFTSKLKVYVLQRAYLDLFSIQCIKI